MKKSLHVGLDNSTGKYEYIQNRGNDEGSGISIFDPVLCELAYRWFSPENGTVLDPFAGGSVRGIVASKLNRQYVGIELRNEQVQANQEQGTQLCADPMPVWKCGNSQNIVELCGNDFSADMIFSCPPYADLEVYSDDPADLSNMEYSKFQNIYSEIIKKSIGLLKPNRFAVFVVGEVRNKKGDGFYRNFVSDTIRAFEDAGASHYNEAILITAIGSLPIRAARPFVSARKLGKTHQNVLVFCKGSAKEATKICGEIQIDESLFTEGVSTDE